MDPQFAAVVCKEHGQVHLSEGDYMRQMNKPDSTWYCPYCGDDAYFDEDYYEDHHGINDDCEVTDEP